MSLCKKLLALTISIFFLFACAGPGITKSEKNHGVYHQIKKGETLWSISHAYHVDLQDLAEINNITNPAGIAEGIIIFVPGADHVIETPIHAGIPPSSKEETKPAAKKPDKPVTELKKTPQPVAAASQAPKSEKASLRRPEASAEKPIEFDRSRFAWPLKGTVTSRFGIQPNGLKNNGIRISAREGTPVLASAAGEVIYAAAVKYYGETIIIKHDGHYSTVYTFLKNRKVKVGSRVKKGEQIAHLGLPENDNGRPTLNFEIRMENKPRNPLFFLP